MKACSIKNLATRACVPCHGGVQRLRGVALRNLRKGLGRGWTAVKTHHLEKEFGFKDFKSALAFTNRVGALAEKQGHHPDMYLAWGRVRILLWTHAVGGVTENDFVLAARIERVKRIDA